MASHLSSIACEKKDSSPRNNFQKVACIQCGSLENELVVQSPDRMLSHCSGEIFQVVRCRNCALCFQNPRPSPELMHQWYPDTYYSYKPAKQKKISKLKTLGYSIELWSKKALRQAFWGYPCKAGPVWRLILQIMLWPMRLRLKLLGKDPKFMPYRGRGRFLDVGCGAGRDLAYQRQFGLSVAGVEFNASAAKAARDAYGIDVRAGTLKEAKFAPCSFDIIHLSHVLEHLPNPADDLSEMHRILDANGLLVIKVPNFESISSKVFGTYWLGLDLPRHFYHFSPKTIQSLLAKNGFAVEKIIQEVGSWGAWRESERLMAREKRKDMPDSRLRNLLYQARELVACAMGKGSFMAIHARKLENAS